MSKKCYIGQTTTSLSRRTSQHHSNSLYRKDKSHFMRALLFYNKTDWEWSILEEVPDSLLNDKEITYIKLYDSFENGYNSSFGGGGGGAGGVKRIPKIYKLWHPENGEAIGTALELSKIIGCAFIRIYELSNKKSKSVKGYVLFEDKDRYKESRRYIRVKPKKEKKVKRLMNIKYNLYHENKGNIYGTFKELSLIIGYSDERIRHLIRGKCTNLKGWKFLTGS